MSSRLVCALALLVSCLLASSPARAQCGGTQLCSPGPGACVVSAACTITVPAGGLTIDLGARNLIITKTLTVQGAAAFVVNAGSVMIDDGSIIAPGSGGVGGSVTVHSASTIVIQNNGLVDVSASLVGGIVDLEALDGFSLAGRIRANGTTRDADGGTIVLLAQGNTTVGGGPLDASGGDRAGGGFIDIETSVGSLSLTAALTAMGGDGGDIVLAADTTLTTSAAADMKVSATGDAGSGGSFDISSGGDITIAGDAQGTGAVSADPEFSDGGDGADYDIFSDTGSVVVSGQTDVSAAAGGFGGSVDFEAGLDLTVTKSVSATSAGIDGSGGDVLMLAGRDITLLQTVTTQGGNFGGSIDIEANGNLDIGGTLSTNGVEAAGNIFLAGCAVTIESDALVSSQGPSGGVVGGATNMVQAGSTLTVAGTMRAGVQNLLRYRMPPAPVTTGATFVPPATIQQDDTIPCCLACPVTTTTSSTTSSSTLAPTSTTSSTSTSTSSSSTSSSTVVIPTTTSSSAAPTTTTSTTIVVATTTTSTTTVPTTTSSSTSAPLPTTTSSTTSTVPTTTSSSTSTVPTTTSTSTSAASTTTTSSTSTSTSTTVSTTTSTSSTTIASSTTTSTTTSTSTSSTTSTAVTSTSTSTSSSTSTLPTTSTTMTPVTTSTTTTLEGDCDSLQGYEEILCRIDLMTAIVVAQDTESFGGPRKKDARLTRLTNAGAAVVTAQQGFKVKSNLHYAGRQIRTFNRGLQKTINNGKTPADVGAILTAEAQETLAEIETLESLAP